MAQAAGEGIVNGDEGVQLRVRTQFGVVKCRADSGTEQQAVLDAW